MSPLKESLSTLERFGIADAAKCKAQAWKSACGVALARGNAVKSSSFHLHETTTDTP